MNEIERLIAGAAAKGPSERLDDRIDELLAAHSAPAPRRRPRWREALVLSTTAAAVGMAGFFLGRMSVARPTESPPTASSHSDPAPNLGVESPREAGKVVHVSLTDRQLADFFATPAGREGAFGNGAAFSSKTLSQPQ